MYSESGVVNVFCVAVLVSVVSAGAPGDEDSFCTNELPSSGTIPPIYPPNSNILLDSYNYVNLLPPQDGAVWQAVDNDLNNEAGRGTEVKGLLQIIFNNIIILLFFYSGLRTAMFHVGRL